MGSKTFPNHELQDTLRGKTPLMVESYIWRVVAQRTALSCTIFDLSLQCALNMVVLTRSQRRRLQGMNCLVSFTLTSFLFSKLYFTTLNSDEEAFLDRMYRDSIPIPFCSLGDILPRSNYNRSNSDNSYSIDSEITTRTQYDNDPPTIGSEYLPDSVFLHVMTFVDPCTLYNCHLLSKKHYYSNFTPIQIAIEVSHLIR